MGTQITQTWVDRDGRLADGRQTQKRQAVGKARALRLRWRNRSGFGADLQAPPPPHPRPTPKQSPTTIPVVFVDTYVVAGSTAPEAAIGPSTGTIARVREAAA